MNNININDFPINLKNKDYESLKKYKKDIIMTLINTSFSEEDKIRLLRDNNFINTIGDEYLELMLNNMSFKSVFNMLQNKELLNRINKLNINLSNTDYLFIPTYLESSDLISKVSNTMLKNMLMNISKEQTINYLKIDYINKRLTKQDIIDIAVNKGINLYTEYNILNTLNKLELTDYINNMWQKKIDFTLVNNKHAKKLLFDNVDYNVDEAIYLYEFINSRSCLTIQDSINDVDSYKSVIASLLIFGINKTKDLIEKGNKKINFNTLLNFKNKHVSEQLNLFVEDNKNIMLNFGKKIVHALDNNDIEYINSVVNLLNFYKFGDPNKMFTSYKEGLISKDKIIEYGNYFSNYLGNIKIQQLGNSFNDIVYNEVTLKSSTLYKYKQKLKKEKIKKLKVKVLIRSLYNNEYYKHFYKNNLDFDKLSDKIANLFGKNANLSDIIYNILLPYTSNNFTIDKALKRLGVEKNSPLYQIYEDMVNKVINKINHFTSYYIDTDLIMEAYQKDIDNYLNENNEHLSLKEENYNVRNRILSLNDIRLLFKDIDLSKIDNDTNTQNFILEHYIYICEGYYNDLVNSFGTFISSKSYNSNLYYLDNKLLNKRLNNPILKGIDKSILKQVINKDKLIANTYIDMAKMAKSSIPYIEGVVNDIKYETIVYPSEELLVLDNIIIDQNISYIKTSDNKIIKVKRIGNTIIFDTDSDLVKDIGKEIINVAKNADDQIDFVLTTNNYAKGIKIDSTIIPTLSEDRDYTLLIANKTINKDNISTNYNLYEQPNTKPIIINKLSSTSQINKVNAFLYAYSIINNTPYEEIDINDCNKIIYYPNMIITYDLNNNEKTITLDKKNKTRLV